MRWLLDTHVLLWALAAPKNLPLEIRKQLDAAETYVSAASIWEVAIKHSLGRIEADPRLVLAAVEPAGFRFLNVIGAHAAAVAGLPTLHKDPFDRMLIAQAKTESLRFVTADAALAQYGDFVLTI